MDSYKESQPPLPTGPMTIDRLHQYVVDTVSIRWPCSMQIMEDVIQYHKLYVLIEIWPKTTRPKCI